MFLEFIKTGLRTMTVRFMVQVDPQLCSCVSFQSLLKPGFADATSSVTDHGSAEGGVPG